MRIYMYIFWNVWLCKVLYLKIGIFVSKLKYSTGLKNSTKQKKPECQQILWIIFPMDKSNQRQMLQFYDVKNANYLENIFLKAP